MNNKINLAYCEKVLYQGYTGVVTYHKRDRIYKGCITNLEFMGSTPFTFRGQTPELAQQDFERVIDQFLKGAEHVPESEKHRIPPKDTLRWCGHCHDRIVNAEEEAKGYGPQAETCRECGWDQMCECCIYFRDSKVICRRCDQRHNALALENTDPKAVCGHLPDGSPILAEDLLMQINSLSAQVHWLSTR